MRISTAWTWASFFGHISTITPSSALVSPHFLCHSHGTHALHRGADLATVRETLGHAFLATTGRDLHARPERSSGD